MPLVSATTDLGLPGLGPARPLSRLTRGVDALGLQDRRWGIVHFGDPTTVQTLRTR